jgi:hypothetical protein
MRVIPLGNRLWQVSEQDTVLGYIDQVTVLGQIRFRVRRLRHPDARWIQLGEYWEFDSAIDACAS